MPTDEGDALKVVVVEFRERLGIRHPTAPEVVEMFEAGVIVVDGVVEAGEHPEVLVEGAGEHAGALGPEGIEVIIAGDAEEQGAWGILVVVFDEVPLTAHRLVDVTPNPAGAGVEAGDGDADGGTLVEGTGTFRRRDDLGKEGFEGEKGNLRIRRCVSGDEAESVVDLGEAGVEVGAVGADRGALMTLMIASAVRA